MRNSYSKLSTLLAARTILGIATSSFAQIAVPGNIAVSGPLTGTGGNLRGEYWKRPTASIPTDGATNPTNRIDKLINGFGPADGTFRATKVIYLGHDITP